MPLPVDSLMMCRWIIVIRLLIALSGGFVSNIEMRITKKL